MSSKAFVVVTALAWAACSQKPAATYGEKISLKEKSDVGALITANDFPEDEVLVTATVQEVCQKKGCWMVVMSGSAQVRVTFKDYGFFVPKDCAGRQVNLQGKLVEKTMTESEARHYAEDAGKSKEEVEKITGDQKTLEFIASGVELI